MSYTQHYPFNDPLEYSTNNAEVVAGLGRMSLVNISNQNFSQPFDLDSGFTYSAQNTEFASGLMRQIDESPTDSLLGVTYSSSLNASWTRNDLSLVAALTGAPVIAGSQLDVTGGGNNGVMYSNADIGLMVDEGTVKQKYTPDYTTSPAATSGILELKDPAGNNNRIALFHHTSGRVRITVYDSTGAVIHANVNVGANVWNPTSGQTYELEFSFKASTGVIELYIDGILLGATPATTYTRTGTATELYIGAGPVSPSADAFVEDVVIYSAVQNTGNYAPGYTLTETKYIADIINIPDFIYGGVGPLQSLDSMTVVETGSPTYTIEGMWWSGAAWVAANGTQAQSNTLATINTNIATLGVVAQAEISLNVFFPSGNILSSVDAMILSFTGQGYGSGYIQPIAALTAKAMGSGYKDLLNVPTGTSYGIIHVVNGVLKYFDGAAWITSDGTVAQSNTKAQVIANAPTLLVGSNASVFVRWVMTTTDANQTPEIEYADVEYSFGAIESTPAVCSVYGYYKDNANNPIVGATVLMSLVKTKSSDYREASNNIIGGNVSVVTDDRGYFSVDLIRSSEYEAGAQYKMTISKESDGIFTSKIGGSASILFSVPDAVSQDITDLITAVA